MVSILYIGLYVGFAEKFFAQYDINLINSSNPLPAEAGSQPFMIDI